MYEVYEDDVHIFTGTAQDISPVIGLASKTVRNIATRGHKRYQLVEVGHNEPVYALYDYDTYVDSGSIEYLADKIGVTKENLKFRQFKSVQSNRNFKYTIHLLEGEYDMVRKQKETFNFVERIFELNIQGVIHTGTVKEIMKCADVKAPYVYNNSILLGKRFAEIKLTNRGNGETHFTTIEDIERDFDIHRNTAVNALYYADGKTKRYIVELTGRRVMDYVQNERHGVVKPKAGYTSIKPIYSDKRQPMSDYWKEVGAWAVKHLQ